jgi:phosphatidylinositol alpha-1,6-mannosyltransferase
MLGDGAYYSLGGIQTVSRFVMKGLKELGLLRTAFFLWESDASLPAEASELVQSGHLKTFQVRRLQYVLQVIWHGVRRPNDIWLSCHINYAWLAFVASGFRPSRVALVVHASELDNTFGWSSRKRWIIRRVGRVIAVSHYTAKKAMQRDVPMSVLRVMYLGDESEGAPFRPSAAVRNGATVLFVGRMDEHYKGQADLLDAMVLLRKRLPRLRLVFVGGGKTLNDWRSKAEQMGLQENVTFAGRVSEARLIELFEAATVFAMPSANEGFGLVYVEAMSHGIPCIGSNRDAACEVIVDGETGWCVPAGNSTALATAIATIVDSPELRARMGTAARRRYEEMFATQHYRQRVRSIMTEWHDCFVRN